ncbi:MAG: type II CAAX endopeptidase family protein [Pseudomonadota bacterium]|nr:type II CAAX endopeptidase family protein [Pseudomonadota bacterium]
MPQNAGDNAATPGTARQRHAGVRWPFRARDAFAGLDGEHHRLALIHSLPGMLVWPALMIALAVVFQFAGGFVWALSGGPDSALHFDTMSFLALALAYFAFTGLMWRRWSRYRVERHAFAIWPVRPADLLAAILVMLFMAFVAGRLTVMFHDFAMADPSLTLSGGASREDVSNVDEFAMSGAALWSVILLTLVAAPLAEEILFRGWMLPMMIARGVPVLFAIVISALAFGLLHIAQGLLVMTSTFLLGIALGVARVATGRVAAPLLGHAANNAFAVFAVPALLSRVPG